MCISCSAARNSSHSTIFLLQTILGTLFYATPEFANKIYRMNLFTVGVFVADLTSSVVKREYLGL